MSIAEKLTIVAENQQSVYDAGKQAEYDRFWDIYQNNGNRTDYRSAFYQGGWTDETFKPKYDLRPAQAGSMLSYSKITDLSALLEELGVTLDFSQSTDMGYVFSNAYSMTRIGVVDCSSATSITALFMNCKVVTIDKLIIASGTSMKYTFEGGGKLENITIEGVISYDGVSFKAHSNLTHDSLMSILNALEDNSASGTTKTCELGTTNLAKLTDAEKAIATEKGWTLA